MPNEVVKSLSLPPAVVEAKRRLGRACTPSEAADVAGVIVGSYPQRNVTNADVYLTQIAVLLGEYPFSVVKELAHPCFGIVGACKFLPSVAEIKELADKKLYELRGVIWAHEREERKREEARKEDTWKPLTAEERACRAEQVRRLVRGFASTHDMKTKSHRAIPHRSRA